MWNFQKNIKNQKVVLAEGLGDTEAQEKKFSGGTALILGLVITVEIMVGGAMLFHFDFHGADMIALLFTFMVLYSGVVAALTDK